MVEILQSNAGMYKNYRENLVICDEIIKKFLGNLAKPLAFLVGCAL